MALDLLLLQHSVTYHITGLRGALIFIDSFSTHVIEVAKFTLDHLQQKTHVLLSAHQLTPMSCIADRQMTFNTSHNEQFMASLGCSLKLVPRVRHGEFNGIVERVNGFICPIARAALVSAALDHTFFYFAVAHAVYVKIRAYHFGIQRTPYLLQHDHSPEEHALRRFGSLCIVHEHQKFDKLGLSDTPSVFLGFLVNNASPLSVVIYNPAPHLTDVRFDESSNHANFQLSNTSGRSLSLSSPMVKDLSKRFMFPDAPNVQRQSPSLVRKKQSWTSSTADLTRTIQQRLLANSGDDTSSEEERLEIPSVPEPTMPPATLTVSQPPIPPSTDHAAKVSHYPTPFYHSVSSSDEEDVSILKIPMSPFPKFLIYRPRCLRWLMNLLQSHLLQPLILFRMPMQFFLCLPPIE